MVFVLLSPSKKMDFAQKRPGLIGKAPHFQDSAYILSEILREKSAEEISDLMKISPALGTLNAQRFKDFDLNPKSGIHDAAIFAYQGDTYAGFKAETADDNALEWAHDHIGILSGLYGLVQPLDMIQPYRLEMGTKLAVDKHVDLYEFWDGGITARINALVKKQKLAAVVGCASHEYLSAVQLEKLTVPFVNCTFKQRKKGMLQTVGLLAKRARGMMARFVVDGRITAAETLKNFDRDGYAFDKNVSTETEFVFIKDL